MGCPVSKICTGVARNGFGDGALAPDVSGCKAQFVTASGHWVVTFDFAVVDFNRLIFIFSPLVSAGSVGVPYAVNITNAGFEIAFKSSTGTPITDGTVGAYFDVNYRL